VTVAKKTSYFFRLLLFLLKQIVIVFWFCLVIWELFNMDKYLKIILPPPSRNTLMVRHILLSLLSLLTHLATDMFKWKNYWLFSCKKYYCLLVNFLKKSNIVDWLTHFQKVIYCFFFLIFFGAILVLFLTGHSPIIELLIGHCFVTETNYLPSNLVLILFRCEEFNVLLSKIVHIFKCY